MGYGLWAMVIPAWRSATGRHIDYQYCNLSKAFLHRESCAAAVEVMLLGDPVIKSLQMSKE
jgi:hypothetical protein